MKRISMFRPRPADLLIGLLTIVLTEGTVAARVIDRVAAVVNGDVVLLSEVDARGRAALDEIPDDLPVDKAVARKREIRRQALDVLIEELLLRQQVRKHKVEVTEEQVAQEIESIKRANNLTDEQFVQALQMEGRTLDDLKSEFRKQLEKRKLIEVQMRSNPEMRAQIQISEKDIQEFYRSHYGKAERVRASHILFSVPPGSDAATEQRARQRARQVLDTLRQGADFAEMAKQHSDDPSGSLGGDLGWFRRGDMVAAFEQAAFGLDKGQISGLVRTQFGFHIIQVTDRGTEEPEPISKVRGRIQQKLYSQKFQRAVDNWVAELRRTAYIDIKL